mmetsp:Transcript_117036/g.335764  ORF Transcript_117036/g.335764 Transcript_117036/m.335764 type:complete len:462 (-) Transcript_117036:60-1445(-)
MLLLTVASASDFVKDPNAMYAARDTVSQLAITTADRVEVILQLGPTSTQKRVEHPDRNGTSTWTQAVQLTYNIAVQESEAAAMVRTLEQIDKAAAAVMLEEEISNYWGAAEEKPDYQVQVTSIVANGPDGATPADAEEKKNEDASILATIFETDVLVGISAALAIAVLCCAIAILWPRRKGTDEDEDEDASGTRAKSKYAASDSADEQKTDAESDSGSDNSGDEFEPPLELSRRQCGELESEVAVLSTILEEGGESSKLSMASHEADHRAQEPPRPRKRPSMAVDSGNSAEEEAEARPAAGNAGVQADADPDVLDSAMIEGFDMTEEPTSVTPGRSRSKGSLGSRSSSPQARMGAGRSDGEKKAKSSKKKALPEKGQKQNVSNACPKNIEEPRGAPPKKTNAAELSDSEDQPQEAGSTGGTGDEYFRKDKDTYAAAEAVPIVSETGRAADKEASGDQTEKF